MTKYNIYYVKRWKSCSLTTALARLAWFFSPPPLSDGHIPFENDTSFFRRFAKKGKRSDPIKAKNAAIAAHLTCIFKDLFLTILIKSILARS